MQHSADRAPPPPTGITTQRTLEHGVELINAEGIQIGPDRYTLKLAFYDNKYVPAEAVTIVEKMLADGTRFSDLAGFGQFGAGGGKTTAVKVLQMSYASGKEHLTAPEFPLSFRVAPTNETAYARVSLAAQRLQGRAEGRPHEPVRRGRIHRVRRPPDDRREERLHQCRQRILQARRDGFLSGGDPAGRRRIRT